MLIPQDDHLAELMDRAAQSLSAAGITVRDLLDDLEQSRADVMLEAYGAEFMADLERRRRTLMATQSSSSEQEARP